MRDGGSGTRGSADGRPMLVGGRGAKRLGGEFEPFANGTRRSSAEGAATRDGVGKAIRTPIQQRDGANVRFVRAQRLLTRGVSRQPHRTSHQDADSCSNHILGPIATMCSMPVPPRLAQSNESNQVVSNPRQLLWYLNGRCCTVVHALAPRNRSALCPPKDFVEHVPNPPTNQPTVRHPRLRTRPCTLREMTTRKGTLCALR